MEPITRKEMFLAKAAGEYNGDLPEPITREEHYLDEIAKGGGSGDAYTKAETDALLAEKADVDDLTTQDATTDDIYIGETLVLAYRTQAQYEQLTPEPQALYVILETPQASLSASPSLNMIQPPTIQEPEVNANELSEGNDENR